MVRFDPETFRDHKLADSFYERLTKSIDKEGKNLGDDQQLAVYYFTPSGKCISITRFGYWNPYMIRLSGADHQGNECTVLLHMQAVQLLVVKEKTDAQPHKKIGFLGNLDKEK
jgi:hypothetical protein